MPSEPRPPGSRSQSAGDDWAANADWPGADAGLEPTRAGSVMGTPAFMPPEQAIGAIDRLDRRSDVFGLGAILCVLLTGKPPFVAPSAEIARQLAARAKLEDAFARLDQCQAEPELIALAKRCLAAEPEERPANAAELAKEVTQLRRAAEERARQAELEQAQTEVLLIEQAKRRRVLQWVAGLIAAVLLAGLGVSLWQMNRAIVAKRQARHTEELAIQNAAEAQAERDAKAKALEAETVARQQSDKRLRQIEKGNDIISSIFTDLDIREIKQGTEPLEAVLAQRLVKAAVQLEGEAVGDPLMVAQLQNRLGRSLISLGHPRPAIELFTKAHATCADRLGADHPDALTSMNNLAAGYSAAGKLDLALPLYEAAALGIEKLRFQHEHAPGIISQTASAYEAAEEFARAEAWRRKWLAHVKERSGAESPAYAGELAALGLNLLQQKKWTDAEPVLRECLAVREKKEPEAWTTFNTLSMLGGSLLGQKKFADAEPLLVKGYEGMKEREKTILPQGSTRIPEALDRLIELYTATNKPDEVKKYQELRAKYSASKEAKKEQKEK